MGPFDCVNVMNMYCVVAAMSVLRWRRCALWLRGRCGAALRGRVRGARGRVRGGGGGHRHEVVCWRRGRLSPGEV